PPLRRCDSIYAEGSGPVPADRHFGFGVAPARQECPGAGQSCILLAGRRQVPPGAACRGRHLTNRGGGSNLKGTKDCQATVADAAEFRAFVRASTSGSGLPWSTGLEMP